MTFASPHDLPGVPQVSMFGLSTPFEAGRVQPGQRIIVNDPVWGTLEVVAARANGAIRAWGACTIQPDWNGTTGVFDILAAEVANTANLGRPACIAMQALADGQWGFFCFAGITPVNCTASVASNAGLGIQAAGQLGAVSAGKQFLNARNVEPAASHTVAKTGCSARSGSTRLRVPRGVNGWAVGVFLSGTGLAAGTTLAGVEPDGFTAILSAATTAAVNGTVTAAFNDGTTFYNIATYNQPLYQGAIT